MGVFLSGNLRKVFTSFLFIPLILFYFSANCFANELLLGTGEIGSFSHFAGKRLCHTINTHAEKVSCRVMPTADYVSSLTNLQGGALDLALVNAKVISDAFNNTGIFRYTDIKYDGMRLLLPLYREPVSLLVRRDAAVGSLDDLAGKRINGGMPLSLQSMVLSEIMKYKGWTEKNFSLFQRLPSINAQDYLAFNNGTVQAMVHIGVHPDEKIQHQLEASKSRIIGVDNSAMTSLAEAKAGFCKCSIPVNSYPGQTRAIETLAIETLLIASSDIKEETIELFLRTLFSKKRHLQTAHPSLLRNSIDIETLNDSYLHPHPAAILFFQQNLHTL